MMTVAELLQILKDVEPNSRIIISDMDDNEHPFEVAVHDNGYADDKKEVEIIINLFKGDGWCRFPFVKRT